MNKYYDAPLVIKYDQRASRVLGGDFWRVIKSFRFHLTPEVWVFVPSGTLTDLGSVPKLFRGIINEQGAAAQAYVVHDQLCEYLSVTEMGKPKLISRQDADLILLDALQASGVGYTTAYLIYNAVAAYQMALQITDPSTSVIKRRLEADYNFEDCE